MTEPAAGATRARDADPPPWRTAPDLWRAGALAITLALLLPLLAILWIALTGEENVWPHLLRTALPRYLANTLQLMLLVALGTSVLGAGTAWMVARYRFPGRDLLAWALAAPLAVPSFIAAYAHVELLEYAGPVQTGLRAIFDWQDARSYWFPEIRSLGGAAVVMSFAFYPYTYILARAAFHEQSASPVEAARSLGCGPFRALWRVALPLARPAIAAGTALALMETLADFGTVEFFAVQTLTVGIFAIWLEGFNPGGAAQLALVALLLVTGLLAIERAARRSARYHDPSSRYRPASGRVLHGRAGLLAAAACLLPILIGFVVPVAVLGRLSVAHAGQFVAPGFLHAALRTILVAGLATGIAIALMLVLAYGVRGTRSRLVRLAARIATLGYAVPGAVLAVGILIPLLTVDRFLYSLELTTGLLLGGSVTGLLAAYVVRFSAIPYGAIEAGFARVTPTMETVARTLGAERREVLARVQIPLLRGTLAGAGLVMFVEASKELPATLILRPFDYDTLATLAYSHASLEQVGRASPAALALIAVGVLPALLFRRQLRRMAWGAPARSARHAGPAATGPVR